VNIAHDLYVKNGCKNNFEETLYLDKITGEFVCMIDDTPNHYKDAEKSADWSKWKEACDIEMKSLKINSTWELVEVKNDMHIVGCRWLLKFKRDENGNIIKFKARLVVQGFTQRDGIDYDSSKIYAPVVKIKTFRFMLSYVCINDYELVQMDVVTAFLNANMDDKYKVYMKQPEGYEDGTNRVCLLKKALYGTKQAPYNWYTMISQFLFSIKWEPTKSDPCLFYKHSKNNKLMLIAIYVDDITSAYHIDDLNEFNEFKSLFMNKFTTTDIGEATWILGMLIQRNRTKRLMFISQTAYAKVILSKMGMDQCKSTSTPEQSGITKQLSEYNALNDLDDTNYPYDKAVGLLLYLAMITRPDLLHTVSILSRYTKNTGALHITMVKRALRYLSGTIHYGLLYTGGDDSNDMSITGISRPTYIPQIKNFGKVKIHAYNNNNNNENNDNNNNSTNNNSTIQANSNMEINGISDANYNSLSESLQGNIATNGKSMSGKYITMGNGTIMVINGKQIRKRNGIDSGANLQYPVAQSSGESEYYAVNNTANTMEYFRNLYDSLSIKINNIPILYCDNQACISIAQTSLIGPQMQHVLNKYHHIKHLVHTKSIQLKFLPSESNIADIFTKSLTGELFINFRDQLVQSNENSILLV
jgi:hypothetical protein